MEHRPQTSRPRIPGGYGNYSGRDSSPSHEQQKARRRRGNGPWGGHFAGQSQVPLPTSPWESGSGSVYGSREEVDWQANFHKQQQQQQEARTFSSVGKTGGGVELFGSLHKSGGGGAGDTGGNGGGVVGGMSESSLFSPEMEAVRHGNIAGYGVPSGQAVAPPAALSALASKHRRRTSPLVHNAPRLTVIPDDDPLFDAQSEFAVEEVSSRASFVPQGASIRAFQARAGGGSTRWRGPSDADSLYGDPAPSERSSIANWSARRDHPVVGELGSGSVVGGGEGSVVTSNRPRPLSTASVRSGVPAAPSPFLRSSQYHWRGSTRRSPLEQSAVNPFSASFGSKALGSRGVGDASNPRAVGGGAGGGDAGERIGVGGGATYGTRGTGRTGGMESGRPSHDRHSGQQIFYKHGVRLVEGAEIQLEVLSGPVTYAVFLLPYMLLALSLWLDLGHLDVASNKLESTSACNDNGVCNWTVYDAPMFNSFLSLKGDFRLVNNIIPGYTMPLDSDPDEAGEDTGDNESVRRLDDGRLPLPSSAILGDHRPGDEEDEFRGGAWHFPEAISGWMAGATGPNAAADERLARDYHRNGTGARRLREDYDRVHLNIGAALEVKARSEVMEDGSELWELLFDCGTRDNVEVVACYTSDGYCDPAVLGHVILDSPETLGRAPKYMISATIELFQEGEKVEGGGALLAKSATFYALTENPAYVSAVGITRVVLLVITAFSFLYWVVRTCVGASGERNPEASAIVPERRYIILLLAGLFLWQNPILAVEEQVGNLDWYDQLRWLRLARDLCQYTGMQLVWFSWICLMDSQHFVRRRRRSEDSYEKGLEAYRQVLGEDAFVTSGDGSSMSPLFLKDAYPPHHPRSESFPDFIVPKVLYSLVSLAVGVSLILLRHPVVAGLDERTDWTYQLKIAHAVLSAVSGLLVLGWVVYFARVTISSGRVLRGQPFMATRRQQLSYRVMFMEGVLVAIMLGLEVGLNVGNIARHLIRQQTVAGALSGLTLDELNNEASFLSTWAHGIREPLGKLLLVSAVCYNLAYLFLPPPHSVKRRFDRMYINMERDMPPREVVRRYKDSKELSPLFCLETSCLLVEVAWQAYYDPHHLNLTDFVAPGKQDLSYLGLSLVQYFVDEETETRAILCRGHDRLVLAFRGTARLENVMTDLKMHQVPLPQLLPRGRKPIVINAPDESRRCENDVHGKSSRRFSHARPMGSGGLVGGERAGTRENTPPQAGRGYSRQSPTATSAPGRPAAPVPTATGTEQFREVNDWAARPLPPEPRETAGGIGGGEKKDLSPPRSSPPAPVNRKAVETETAGKQDAEEDRDPIPSKQDEAAAESDGSGTGADRDAKDVGDASPAEAADEAKPDVDDVKESKEEDGGSGESAGAGAPETEGDGVVGVDDDGRGVAALEKKVDDAHSPEPAPGSAPVPAPVPVPDPVLEPPAAASRLESSGRGNREHHRTAVNRYQLGTPAGAARMNTSGSGGTGHGPWGDSPARVAGYPDGPGLYHDGYEEASFGDSEDMERVEIGAGAPGIGEGKFHIDPRGDGSFATSVGRCFKAVIHRIPVARQALPRVHGGFWEVYSKLREQVLATLAAEMEKEYRPLYLTGHSLGGALASLAAYDVDKNFTLPDPIMLYTFGSPQVGNGVFARKMQQKVKHHFRVVNDGDLVTGLPKFFGTYRHAGCKVVVDSERYGNFSVAPTLVEETFGAKPLTSVGPHFLAQYRDCLEACMEEADLKDYVCQGLYMAAGGKSKVDPDHVPEWLKGKRRKDKEEDAALLG